MLGRVWVIVAAVVLGWAAPALAQTHVRLRAWAAAPRAEGGVLRLADVAEITGDDAERLGAIVVKRGSEGGETLELADVRGAMESAGGVNWGLVTLSGARCVVRAGDAAPAKPSGATARPAALRLLSGGEVAAGSVRAAVIARLESLFGAEAGALRASVSVARGVVFDLDGPVADGDQVHVEAGASGLSGRVPMRVEIYRDGRMTNSVPLDAEVEVRRVGARVTRIIERGEAISAEALASEEAWASPGSAGGASVESALGSIAKRRLTPGTMLMATDIQAPVVVNRGDEVWVHVLSGELRMKVKARALGSARDGEIVKLQVDGSKRPFEARMSGRGVAIKVVDGEAGAPPSQPEAAPAPMESRTGRVEPAGARTAATGRAGAGSSGGVKYMDLHRDNVSPGLRARREKEAAK